MIDTNKPADPAIHAEAIRLARACRNVIRGLLRDEEVKDCDFEFYAIIRESLERHAPQKDPPGARR